MRAAKIGDDDKIIHTAFVEYKVAGKPFVLQRRWTSDVGSAWSWPNYQSGEKLRVVYLPADPYQASILSIAEVFLIPTFFLGAGLAFGAFGFAAARGASSDEFQASASSAFRRAAIAFAALAVGGGALYYFAGFRADIERQRLEEEAAARDAAARQAAAQARAAAAKDAIYKAAAEQAAAARVAMAALPVPARPGMSHCERLLLDQRNQYAQKYPAHAASFFNIKSPAGVDCKDCRESLAGNLRSRLGFAVAASNVPSGYKAGCIAYRKDIFGTVEGANCLVEALGHKFTADQSCYLDGFPYTITHLAHP